MKKWSDLKWWDRPDLPAIYTEIQKHPHTPAWKDWYRAIETVQPEDVRVVILGQDPYPTPGYATGLAFSVPKEIRKEKFPPTLTNIFTELGTDLSIPTISYSGCLDPWAAQGVLLLNTSLTCLPGKPGSHEKLWRGFAQEVLESVKKINPKAVFVLWGNHARKTMSQSNIKVATTLVSAHPAPLSARRGFFGSRPFSTTNALLVQSGQKPIDWRLE